MTVTPFRICVPDDVLDDLRGRLDRARFTTASDTAPWAAGTDPGYLRQLAAYWAGGFDWRAAEQRLNAYPQYVAEVAGRRVHFVHLRAKPAGGAPRPLPLIMTHGWPSSFVEMLDAGRLTPRRQPVESWPGRPSHLAGQGVLQLACGLRAGRTLRERCGP